MNSFRSILLSFFATTLTSLFIVLMFYHNWQSIRYAEKVNEYHVPTLQLSAIGVRLTESINFSLQLAVQSEEARWLEKTLLYRDALLQAMDEFNRLSKTYFDSENLEAPVKFNRKPLTEVENIVLDLIRNKNFKAARMVLSSDDYQSLQSDFQDQIQMYAELTAIDRDQMLERSESQMRRNLVISVLIFFLVITFSILVFFQYQSMQQTKHKAHAELQSEREKTFHAAKLSSLGEMAGSIAHEINNPLAIISGYARRLRSLIDDPVTHKEKITRYSTRIEETSYRIAKIINSLRKLSRNSTKEHFEETSLPSIFEDVFEISASRFKENQIAFEKPEPTPNLQLRCRGVQISQVLLNLLNNAYDAALSSPNPKVCLEIEDLGAQIKIQVKDNGAGFKAEDAEKLFEPFYTTKDASHGTGLGLSISRRIVDDHGGTLRAFRANEWTSFELLLWKEPEAKLPKQEDFEIREA